MNKLIAGIVGIAVFLIGTFAICMQFAHKIENQNLAIVQSMTGDVEVRRIPGWWLQISPTIWEYPKAGIYQLNSKDRDTLKIQFNNKSTAELRCMIGYRIDTASDEVLVALHQQVEAQDEKIWQMVLTALNTVAQSITTKYDPSMVIGGDKFDVMIKEMYTAIMKNPELMKHGIEVNYFAVDGRPIPDKDTEAQFNKQREADLSRRLAEAEKLKLEAEKVKVEANYAMQIAEQRGKAEAEMANQVQAAEKEKRLAEIAAEKQVTVQELQKKEMLIKAQKEKEVAAVEAEKMLKIAEIQKKTESEKLEVEKLVAEQLKVAAEAKKIQIEKSGAITEQERVKLEFDMKTKIGVAEQMSKTYAHWNPQVIQVSGSNGNVGSATSSLDGFLNMKAAEAALNMTKKSSAK